MPLPNGRVASDVVKSIRTMYSVPKSSAEILAAASHKPTFNDRMSTFSAQPSTDIPHASSLLCPASCVPQTGDLRFKDLVTPQRLKAALEIKKSRDVEDRGCYEDLFDDAPPLDTWVYFFIHVFCSIFHIFLSFEASDSEPESPVDSVSSSQTGRSTAECVLDILAVLRAARRVHLAGARALFRVGHFF